MTFEKLDDIKKLKGEFESSIFEFKERIIETDKILKQIHGFLNGIAPIGYLIIGVPEKDGKADTDNLVSIKFPLTLKDGKKIKDFDEYKHNLYISLQNHLPEYTEGMVRIKYIEETIICIAIIKNNNPKPIFNKQHQAYIRRDGHTTLMTAEELEQAFLKKEDLNTELEDFLKYINSGDTIVTRNNKSLHFSNGAYAYIYITPNTKNKLKRHELITLARNNLSHIFGNNYPKGISYEFNKYGVCLFDQNGDLETLSATTQIFDTGSVLGIVSLKDSDNKTISGQYIEQSYIDSLKVYLKFSKSELRNNPPIKVVAGIHGIKEYSLAIKNYMERYYPKIHKNEFYYEFNIKTYECNPEEGLEPFFDQVWDGAGIPRPTDK